MESYLATCPEETKQVLIQELLSFGAVACVPAYRAVKFSASVENYYKMHLGLSTASNLFHILKECAGKSSEMLFSQAKRVSWNKLFSVKKTYKVVGIAGDRGKDAMSSNQISKQVRLAIEDVFQFNCGSIPRVDLKNPEIIISVHIHNGRASICMNTSGKSLHKRGYRKGEHPAPLKETMAASLLRLADFDGNTTFFDPMCGSGTIAIEACFLALNKSCNIHRKKGSFSLEHGAEFDKNLWRNVQDSLRQQKLEDASCTIYASDIEQKFVGEAEENALRARVAKHIKFSCQSFFDSQKPEKHGVIVSNLPYGERLDLGPLGIREFYKKIGDHLKQEYSGWKAFLFVNEDSPWKHVGLKPSKKIPLKNGSIKTKLLCYDLYSGSKKLSSKK